MKTALVVLSLIVCLCQTEAGTKTASLVLRSTSIQLKPVPFGDPSLRATNFITTYDGRSEDRPLTQALEFGRFLVSSELRPRANVPGVYEADVIMFSSYYGWLAYGSYIVTLPAKDLDGNGLPDFLQKEIAANETGSGTAFVEWSVTSQTAMSTFAVRFIRDAGQEQGTCITTDDSTHAVTSGTWVIGHCTGTFNYNLGNTNLAQLSLVMSEKSLGSYTASGMTSYRVIDQDHLEIPAFFVTSISNETWQTTGKTILQRQGNKYVGPSTLTDGGLLTSWPDYTQWVLEITDTNDADRDGIPDLTDLNQAPLTIRMLGMVSPQKVQLQLNVVAGQSYTVQRTANFLSWFTVTNFIANAPSVTITDVASFSRQFYRVKAP